MQAAVLEHHALAGLHTVIAAIEDAADQHVGRVLARIIHACVAVLAEANFDLRRTGRTDTYTKIRSEQNVRVTRGGEAHLDCSVIESHHQAGRLAGSNAGAGSQFDGRRGADAQHAAMGQHNFSRLIAGGHRPAGADDGLALRNLKRTGNLGRGVGVRVVEGHYCDRGYGSGFGRRLRKESWSDDKSRQYRKTRVSHPGVFRS